MERGTAFSIEEGRTMKEEDSVRDFSRLPEEIIHHILSYINLTKQPRFGIVCKTWYAAWLTNPILRFSSSKKRFRCLCREKIERFINCMDPTLQRYREKTIPIRKLILSIKFNDFCSVSRVDEWIRIAVQNGVKTLDLRFCCKSEYTMPSTVWEANSITKLRLYARYEQVVTMKKQLDDKIMFNRLLKLYLENIEIDNDTFEGILSSCPLIEKLWIEYCHSLERIKVTKLHKLNEIIISDEDSKMDGRNLNVEIEAPNLVVLYCDIHCGSLKLCKTDKLQYLSLYGSIDLSLSSLENWEHNFPQVKNLILSVKGQRRINLSGHSLKHIALLCEDLREVNIDTPNMKSLEVAHNKIPDYLHITNAPTQLALKISFNTIDTDHFCKLKRLLAQMSQSKISLHLLFGNINWKFVDVGGTPTIPIAQVEDLNLDSHYPEKLVESYFLEALFQTCHPKAILLNSRTYPYLLGYLSKKLIRKRKRQNWSQELKEVKLEVYDRTIPQNWSEELKEAQLEVYDKTRNQWPSRWITYMPEERVKVCFRLKWIAN